MSDLRTLEVRVVERVRGGPEAEPPGDAAVLARGREAAARAREKRRAIDGLLGSLDVRDLQTTGGQ